MTVSDIIQIIIAVLALFIATLQLLDQIRKNREDKEKKEKAEKISSIADACLSMINDETWMNSLDYHELLTGFMEGKGDFPISYIRTYRSVHNNCLHVYETLLECESSFSLSYGFGRYIDALRGFLFTDRTAFLKSLREECNDLFTPRWKGDFSKETKASFSELANDYQKLIPYLKEMTIKFGGLAMYESTKKEEEIYHAEKIRLEYERNRSSNGI